MSKKPKTLEPGQPVADFTLPDVRGAEFSLSQTLESHHALLVFYRGGWCPLCNRQLAQLSERYEELQALGVQLAAISNEQVTQGQQALKKMGPPYPLLIDEASAVIGAFGLIVASRDPLGFVLRKHAYAHPAVVLVSKDREVLWSYYGRSYRDRPSAQLVVNESKRALATI